MIRHRLIAVEKWRQAPPFFVPIQVKLRLIDACRNGGVLLYSGYNPDVDDVTFYQVLSGINHTAQVSPGIPMFYRVYGEHLAHIEVREQRPS